MATAQPLSLRGYILRRGAHRAVQAGCEEVRRVVAVARGRGRGAPVSRGHDTREGVVVRGRHRQVGARQVPRQHAEADRTHRGHHGHACHVPHPPRPPPEARAAHPRKLKKSQVRGRAVGRGRRAPSSTRPTGRDIDRDGRKRMSPRAHNSATAGNRTLCEAIPGILRARSAAKSTADEAT